MKKIFLTTLLAVCSLSIHAQFSGQGSGTEKDPYQITNADELFEMRNALSAYYIVMNDIDLTEWIAEGNSQQGWTPIGTASLPFTGTLDGNNYSIKGLFVDNPKTEAAGLFGYAKGAVVRNLGLINPKIYGGTNVGSVVGRADCTTLHHIYTIGVIVIGNENVGALAGYMLIGGNGYGITENVVVGGYIRGGQYVGGIIGRAAADNVYSTRDSQRVPKGGTIGSYSYELAYNHCSATISSEGFAGGIAGSVGGFYMYDGNGLGEAYAEPLIHDNQFVGRIITGEQVGGIVGSIEPAAFFYLSYGRYVNGEWKSIVGQPFFKITCNLVGGYLQGKNVQGVLYSLGGQYQTSVLSKNICYADTLNAEESIPMKISTVADENNYSSASTILMQRGKVVSVEPGKEQGSSLGNRILKRQSTYEGLGFDFDKRWSIKEEASFPYFTSQSKPADVSSFFGGSRAHIWGTASGTGKIYVLQGDIVYEGNILDGGWEMYLGNLNIGVKVAVVAHEYGRMPSALVEVTSESAPSAIATPGDANGDGAVDSADVTAIINFILGKPGASFNKENADVTGDGQILIDDAVQTVQLIMDAQ